MKKVMILVLIAVASIGVSLSAMQAGWTKNAAIWAKKCFAPTAYGLGTGAAAWYTKQQIDQAPAENRAKMAQDLVDPLVIDPACYPMQKQLFGPAPLQTETPNGR